jgi:hypothetical protein
MPKVVAPAFVRGRLITDNLVRFGGRRVGEEFYAPDPASFVDQLPEKDPGALRDLYDLRLDDILDYLVELGRRLDLSKNEYLQESLEHSAAISDMTYSVLKHSYCQLAAWMSREMLYEMVNTAIGVRYLEGWNPITLCDGRVASIRAMGARTLHIVAGNSPLVAVMTIARNSLARSDAIIKTPSNDPLTSLAVVRTMLAMAPDHPLTRHISCAYWKGGETPIEDRLYQPANIEKIVAWGGHASVKHVTRYIQPGIELITLDPKRSATVIGREAFDSEAIMREVALRAATDIGAMNQLGCVNARVIYVASGTDSEGVARANRLGKLIYEAMLDLPSTVSTKAKRFDPELRGNIQALRASPDYFRVVGSQNDEGAIIISQYGGAVDFYQSLSGRVANIVPINDPLDAAREMNTYTQTIGVYPESLKLILRDVLPLYGAQRMVSLGYAATGSPAVPHDAIEPFRRIVKWIVDESCDPAVVPPLWKSQPNVQAEA